jgi:cobalt/nickel transport system permease protein
MHIPDGFLTLQPASAAAAASASGLWAALRRLRHGMPRRKVPLMGLAAAFLFAAQMLNFPVAGGTSGHLLGAVLAGILLGPSAAMVVMTSVLVVQCLLFADGGVLALGANVLNMAIAAVLGGHAVFRAINRLLPSRRGFLAATAFAAWCSTVLASVLCAGELAWSGVAPWGLVFPAMANIHMLIGLGEGAITTLVIVAIQRTRPDLVGGSFQETEQALSPRPHRLVLTSGVVVTLGLLLSGLPLASRLPDGLERVAESLGFAGHANARPLVPSPMIDHRLPGIGSATIATCAAGFVGTLVAFLLAYGLAVVLAPRSGPRSDGHGED